MSTKPTKPAKSTLSSGDSVTPTPPPGGSVIARPSTTSAAKAMQAKSEAPPQPHEDILAITLRADNSYEYHLDLPRSVVVDLLDPDVDDAFIEVPCVVANARRFLHTSYVKEVDVRGL